MGRQAMIGCSLLLGLLLSVPTSIPASAASARRVAAWHHPPRRAVHAVRYHFIWCVPYARDRSGIDITGNAWQWWANAAGRYARGQAPSVGSVLVFRAISRMPLGHVAVVSRIVNAREILVDQANWVPAGVVRLGVPVLDVSRDNDWTAVRVGVGNGNFGTVYPTYGFIYRGAAPRTEHILRLPTPPAPPIEVRMASASGRPIAGTEARKKGRFGTPLFVSRVRFHTRYHAIH